MCTPKVDKEEGQEVVGWVSLYGFRPGTGRLVHGSNSHSNTPLYEHLEKKRENKQNNGLIIMI